ncbi:class I SAM-dependent methyltransferase [Staphylococcus pseudintermedius]|uniref:class I SAM-dependent methyltransferase n=1 Tax=Staphylococcus pseudintermedius TaxID=283734 RepID=UPI001BDEB43A|nr:class I SAM-dependent methyltransferase [Staphylococcus pseudintermedius]EJA1860819.1 class I SAM-dependent methyltransferase [Staphylococcus pseudintermedius]EKH2200375.1 class I SAM-dependent methyltransferase [Staphylococcus pseudintermedius]EMB9414036.1 class I SAM-dependent methyltransferase [Staphylococcus pseudintermedius]MBU7229177.1 class I SAM-dependent methyltransferase [Staphylococcus pseudintermedius]HCA7013334.1 class I SAM-dependent methyltransferase [Staphylococcus pseudinte
MDNLFKYVKIPKTFEEGKDNIWKNEKFSDYVLKSHLNSNIYGGSKDSEFIEKAVTFISKNFPPGKFNKLLDVGCGPGIYSEKFSEKGYDVTGIDYSVNSIDYAKNNQKGQAKYVLGDLRNLDIKETFNIILIVYQTYATLSYKERIDFLYEVYKKIEHGGIFILDVPTKAYFKNFQDMKVWEYMPENNDFIQESFLLLYLIHKYENAVLLKKSIYTLQTGEVIEFNDWMQHFDVNSIKDEVEKYFEVVNVLSEIDGSAYTKESHTITLICKKL